MGNKVIVHDGNVERALRKSKKKVANSGILLELRDREHYVKPTTRRKLKLAAAKRRLKKQIASQQLPKKDF